MGQWTGRFHALLFQGDRGGLGLPDPDREISVAVRLPQQQDGLVLRLLNSNADHANLTHVCLPPALVLLQFIPAVAGPDPTDNPSRRV
ncbi:hypothetical protein MDUV_13230 [Mycolicibacterium duvalii]|uniref:Uncharacterized protein n=1 Tax=Mycolicibacterium duvalii TaxID=39688 RepID=A0A7I7JXI0_9MYCO|nr:hypothetical protein MDUV_13230 [Mycolicibacterium duvalii]